MLLDELNGELVDHSQAVALTFVEVLTLQKTAFLEIAFNFPGPMATVNKAMRRVLLQRALLQTLCMKGFGRYARSFVCRSAASGYSYVKACDSAEMKMDLVLKQLNQLARQPSIAGNLASAARLGAPASPGRARESLPGAPGPPSEHGVAIDALPLFGDGQRSSPSLPSALTPSAVIQADSAASTVVERAPSPTMPPVVSMTPESPRASTTEAAVKTGAAHEHEDPVSHAERPSMQHICDALAGVTATQSTLLAEVKQLGQQMARSEARQQEMESQLTRMVAACALISTAAQISTAATAEAVQLRAQPAEDETADDNLDVVA
jgi:hypothetical protein